VHGTTLPRISTAPVSSSGDLVQRVREGDAGALGTLYDLHHGVVRAFARRLLRDEAAAEDLVHDVFVALPRALERFEGKSSLRTYLVSIAVNHARHHDRGTARRLRALERYHETRVPDASVAPDEASAQRRLAAIMGRALETLPMEQRIVIVLCTIEERTSVEVAEILGVPEGTVRTRLFHARRKLREQLTEEGLP
jgi:RNA polymerase sigma-70 factor (ECF subfamily)